MKKESNKSEIRKNSEVKPETFENVVAMYKFIYKYIASDYNFFLNSIDEDEKEKEGGTVNKLPNLPSNQSKKLIILKEANENVPDINKLYLASLSNLIL